MRTECARAYGWLDLDRLDEVAAVVEVSMIGTFPIGFESGDTSAWTNSSP